MRRELIREETFTPYVAGYPVFILRVWDSDRPSMHAMRNRLAYELIQLEQNAESRVLFSGEDFGPSPMHADDSDDTIAALMGFLTLRPGDTDREYFAGYTADQLDFCASHAEALQMEVIARFGDDR